MSRFRSMATLSAVCAPFILLSALAGCARLAQEPAISVVGSAVDAGGLETIPAPVGIQWVIAIHGGSGVRSGLTPGSAMRAEYEAALQRALTAGARVLGAGGRGPDAVVAALQVLEDSALFNAGHGAAIDETGAARLGRVDYEWR